MLFAFYYILIINNVNIKINKIKLVINYINND